VIDHKAGIRALQRQLDAVAQFRGPHAQVEAEAQLAQQLHILDKLGRQTGALRRARSVQHLADALDRGAAGIAPDVIAELGGGHGAADHSGGSGVVIGGAEFDQMLRLGDLLCRGYVHLHVYRLDDVQPRGRVQIIAGYEAAVQRRRVRQPRHVEHAQIPKMLMGIDDGKH